MASGGYRIPRLPPAIPFFPLTPRSPRPSFSSTGRARSRPLPPRPHRREVCDRLRGGGADQRLVQGGGRAFARRKGTCVLAPPRPSARPRPLGDRLQSLSFRRGTFRSARLPTAFSLLPGPMLYHRGVRPNHALPDDHGGRAGTLHKGKRGCCHRHCQYNSNWSFPPSHSFPFL